MWLGEEDAGERMPGRKTLGERHRPATALVGLERRVVGDEVGIGEAGGRGEDAGEDEDGERSRSPPPLSSPPPWLLLPSRVQRRRRKGMGGDEQRHSGARDRDGWGFLFDGIWWVIPP